MQTPPKSLETQLSTLLSCGFGCSLEVVGRSGGGLIDGPPPPPCSSLLFLPLLCTGLVIVVWEGEEGGEAVTARERERERVAG